MKRTGIVMILGAVCGLSGATAHVRSSGASASAQAEPTGARLAGGTAIIVELKDSLDSKKLKPGDPVTFRTAEAYKSKDQIVLPRGTQVLGHVTQATVKEKGQNESSLGIALDKAILKNGEEMPVHATVQAMASGDQAVGDASAIRPGLGEPGPGVAAPGARPGMSATGSQQAPSSPNPGNQVNSSVNPIQGVTGPGDSGLNSAGQLTSDSRGVYGMEGLTLQPAAEDSTQGTTILSTGKSVHLNAGTKLLLVTK
jgi:hypothetical protein